MANPTHPTCSLAPLWPHTSATRARSPLARPRAFQHQFSVPGLFHVPAGVLLPDKLPQSTQPCCLSTPLRQSRLLPQQHHATSPGDGEPTVPEGQGHAAKPGSLPIPFIPHTCPQTHTRTHTYTWRWAHTACFSLPSSLDTSLFIWILLPNEFSLVVELEWRT